MTEHTRPPRARRPGAPFVPLHLQSHFSLLHGTASLAELATWLDAEGIEAAALVDRNNVYGAVFWHAAMAKLRKRAITGAEVDGVFRVDDRVREATPRARARAAAVLLARDFNGYENVCRVVSARQLDPQFDLVHSIIEDARGLFVLVREPALAEVLRPHLAPGALWMEVSLWTGPRMLVLQRETARALGIGLVAGGALAMRTSEDVMHQRVLAAIRTNGVASEMRSEDLADPESYLRPVAELTALLSREAPEALANARQLADACTLNLLRDKPIFPDFSLDANETAYSRLHQLSYQGLRSRYGDAITPEITERLDRELRIIHKTGFSEYFLVVGDLVKFAREKRIPVVGRGSGASSIVAYILGITSVDPIRYRLYFERFLNSLRDDWPDLDVDICWRGRDDVIEYAYERYGRDRVAMISTHNHYHPRSAFRDVARAFGIPTDTVNRISKRMPREMDEPIPSHFGHANLLREYPRNQEPYRAVLHYAEALRGAPRHLGIHCGGIVIGDRPLARLSGLEEATKGIVVTQYEMDSIEQIGLIKIDLLGNRAISTIRETLSLVRERRGEDIDMDTIPHDEAKTSALLKTGRTLGCFQIESPGMRNLLRMIGTKNMRKTIAAHSLIRPGPASSGMKEAYVKRVRGMDNTRFKHPALGALIGDLLEDTFGVPLYEEDVMAVASRVTGISLEEGDLLRRRIGEAKDEEKMRALTHTFLALAVQRGVDIGIAKEAWRLIARFASYSFCRAHAAGYGGLAYQTAWLKANYPVEHAVSLLNNHQGMYPTRVHFEEARRRGIPILLPCVQRSEDEFVLEEVGGGRESATRSGCECVASLPMLERTTDPPFDAGIRVGLGFVRDLSHTVRERIYAERPFRSLGHFLRQVAPPRRDAENLILIGAFDWAGLPRTELLWELYAKYDGKKALRAKEKRGRDALFTDEEIHPGETGGAGGAGGAGGVRTERRIALTDFSLEEKLHHEIRILGLAISAHPIALIRGSDRCRDAIDARAFHESAPPRSRVVFVGVRDAWRTTPTKKGEIMMFLTLEDEHDLVECTLFPRVYKRNAEVTRMPGPFRVTGRVDEQYGVKTITVDHLEAFGIDAGLMEAL